ncbi:DUF3418 domain-containing protein [Nakamurella sp. YIM 132084]|uniref:DUF3418 domain-containing protein n=2 Tax=Nakamurella leprariae TaxID=2803911 RepID=A0A939C2B6_9ACTN|nr:DUF3418 domain-containing protein [Nakamurella leprariae]
MCRREYLHWLRIREWQDLHAQLEQIARGLGMDTTASARTNVGLVLEQPQQHGRPESSGAGNGDGSRRGRGRRRRPAAQVVAAAPEPAPQTAPAAAPGTTQPSQPVKGSLAVPVDVARVHTAVLAGLLSHLGSRPEASREYQGTRGSKWMIWPGSALSRSGPPLAVAAELVETSRLWGRVVARIEPEWAEQVGEHLLKRSYSEPRWSAKRGATVATERVTLLGVTLFAARTVQFDRIDPELCRELFIRHALVERDWPTRHAFAAANRRAVDEVAEWEDRLRRRDLLDDEVLFAWYDQRIPADITDARRFDRWWKTQSRTQPGLLTFTADQLVAELQRRDAGFPDSELGRDAFPDTFAAGPVELDLDYTFDPARSDDGVSVTIPLAVLSRVDPAAFGRQIPGLRRDLTVALIRSLPKQLRRNFVPVPDFAAAALQRIDQAGDGSSGLPDQLATALTALTGVVVRAADFDVDKVPDHLRMTFKIVNEAGEDVAAGKDLASLQHRLRDDTRTAVASAVARDSRSLERPGQTTFPPEGVPRQVTTTVAGQSVTAYPALLDRGTVDGAPRVDLVVLTDPDDQRLAHRTGTVRLLGAGLTVPISFLRQALSRTEMMLLATSGHGSTTALVQDATVAVVDALLDWAGGPPWTAAEFEARRERIAGQLNRSVLDVLHAAGQVVQAANAARDRIDGIRGTALTRQVADLQARLTELVGGDFVARTGAAGLPDLVRYLQALEVRAQRLAENPDRDRQRMAEIAELSAAADEVVDAVWHRRGLAALVDGRAGSGARVGPELDPRVRELRRLLAEYRVALFAQPMRTAVPVSAKRIGAAVADLRATMGR